MTREDLARFAALPIDFGAIGLLEPGVPQEPYFCDPVDGEPVGRLGCDGVHFILLPGDERVFCVDPAMGEPGRYVLPVAEDFRQFLSFVLFCGDANPISQIWWTEEEQFRDFLKEESERSWEGMEDVLEQKELLWPLSPPHFPWRAPTPMRRSRLSRPVTTPPTCSFQRTTTTF